MNKKNKGNIWNLVRLAPFIGKYKKWIIISIFASLCNAAVDVLSGDYIKYLTDSTLEGQILQPFKIIFIIIILLISGGLSKYIIGSLAGSFSFHVIRDLRNSTIENIEKIKVSWLESNNSGQIVAKLTSDINILQVFLKDTLPNIVYNVIVFILTFAYLSSLNWRLSVVAISVVPISISVISLLSKPIGKYAKNEQQSMECIMAVAQDSLSGVYIEKAYNLSGIMQNKFEDAVNKGLVNSLKRQKITSYLTPFQTITKWIPLLLCAIYGGYFVFYNQITTGSLFAFIYLLQYFVEPISKIQDFLSEFRGVSVSIERINELLTMENERSDGESYKLDLSKAILTFNNVCFGYPEENQTLKDISFTIEHRKSVALVGGSGSGKSTIFKLICGFYQAQSGSISLCENNLDLWDLDKAREQIALVSQDVYLFPTTIIENISIGRSEATLEEIINAAKMANAHEFILQLSDGYNTIVGERGCNLSGGQKQRISIARAILKNAPIILLDEPTSALDVQSEVMVQNALNRLSGKHTIIVIAHRLTTIKNVDKILVMDKGMIVEEGNHEQLIAKDGVYKKLYIRQIKNIDNSNLVQGV